MSRAESGKFPAPPFSIAEEGCGAASSPDFNPPFDVLEPAALGCPLVFSSPHSGRSYPSELLNATRLDPMALRRSEDVHVDTLFAGVVTLGAPLIRALFPRAYLDVNREPYELDPRMFEGLLPSYANTRSIRVAGGLGTIPRIVGDSQEIYSRKIPVSAALARIDALYKPYHRALRGLFQRALVEWSCAILIDCHSMPSSSAVASSVGACRPRADIVLGDRYGASCHPAVSDTLETALRRRGYAVQRNAPYAGGFITEHYGNPQAGAHAVQIEVNRSLYLDERSFALKPQHAALSADLLSAVSCMIELVSGGMPRERFAAE